MDTNKPPAAGQMVNLEKQKKPPRKRSPAQSLIMAKRRLDDTLAVLTDFSDLHRQCRELRDAVLEQWVAEERKLPE